MQPQHTLLYCSAFEQVVLPGIRRLLNDSIIIIIIIIIIMVMELQGGTLD